MRPTTLVLAALALLGVLVTPTAAGAEDAPTTTSAPAPATTTTTVGSTTTTVEGPTSTTSTVAPAGPTSTAATPAPTTTTTAVPTVPGAGAEGASGAPKVRGVGDSVFHSAQSRVEARLQPEYRPRFVSRLGALVRDLTPTAVSMAGNHPAAMVFGLANPDIAELDERHPPRLKADALALLQRTASVPCRVWINVKEVGVNGYYNPNWATAARAFNQWLADGASPGGRWDAPGLHVLDWSTTAARHPGWFLADGLHLNATGQAGYAGKLDRFLTRVCPP